MSIQPLKNALKLLHLKELQEQSKSLCKKKEDSSVLRAGSKCYQQLVSFNWAKLLTEWQERAPDVLDAVTAIAVPENCLSQPKRADTIIPPLCTAFSTLMNTRNAELSLVQKMVSIVLGLGGCSKMVCSCIEVEISSIVSQSITVVVVSIKSAIFWFRSRNILIHIVKFTSFCFHSARNNNIIIDHSTHSFHVVNNIFNNTKKAAATVTGTQLFFY